MSGPTLSEGPTQLYDIFAEASMKISNNRE